VTPDSKIYCEKVKICWFSSGNWFFSTKFVQVAVAAKVQHTVVHLQKRVINWTWLQLSICDWSIIMIGPGGMLLVVPTYMQFQLQFYWWVCQKRAKVRHLISLSRVTYWAPVEMLLTLSSLNPNPIIRNHSSRTKPWCNYHLNLSKILSLCFNVTTTKIWILFICCIPSLNIDVLYSSYLGRTLG
jgi:hypothetical protein